MLFIRGDCLECHMECCQHSKGAFFCNVSFFQKGLASRSGDFCDALSGTVVTGHVQSHWHPQSNFHERQ